MSDVPLWLWALLASLLFCSGLFSSSETALFSLTPEQRIRAGPSAARLIARPRPLLFTVLFMNLVVNVLFFAFAGRLLDAWDGVGDLTVGFVVLVALLVCGEILPKTLGLRARVGVARLTSPVLSILVAVIGPLGAPLIRFLETVHRFISSWAKEEKTITPEVLERVMERGAEEGLFVGMEANLLAEVIELDDVRVREIMTPRVDALFLDISGENRNEAVAGALAAHQSWLPVIEGDPDHVLGRVRVRDLLRRKGRPVGQLVMPVKFVPEVASALDLLRALREDRTAEAVVVDEWGGTAGYVTAEDALEEVVGDLRTEGEERVPAVVPLGEGRFRIAGGLSIRDWNDEFGLHVVPTEYETVGGFVTATLGRIPRAGDEARVGRLLLEVHEVRGRRVLTVDISVDEEAVELAEGVAT